MRSWGKPRPRSSPVPRARSRTSPATSRRHSASLRMYEALSAAGAHVEMHMYDGLPHGFARVPSLQDGIQAEIASFLDRTMVAPERLQAELEELAAQMQ